MIESHAPPSVPLPSDRRFGLFFAALSAGLAAWLAWRAQVAPAAAAGLCGVAFAVFALLAPRRLAPLNRAWAALGALLARIVNPIVLGLLFFVVVTPYALAMRLVRRDALRLARDPSAASYWIERAPPGPDAASFERQY